MSEHDPALRTRFRELALERLRTLNQVLMALENGESESASIDEAMREIHTLKGEARMLGLGALNRVAHRTEDLLLGARREGRLADPARLEHVYAGFDLLAALLEEFGEDAPGADDPRAVAFLARAEEVLGRSGDTGGGAAAPGADLPPGGRGEGTSPGRPAAAASAPASPAKRGVDGDGSQRVSRTTIDEITRTAGEVGVLQAHLRQFAEDATDVVDRLGHELGTRTDAPPRVAALLKELQGALRAMRDGGFDASIRQNRLQTAVERMRLAPVSTLFDRFPRTVRDLARELGKEARLVVGGANVGADQQVLDLLGDPLVHLIRNALDHGLEPPETREAEGKPRHGTVRLDARQSGRFVEILVGDDGRGIDPTAVAESAVRRGLLSEADVQRMSERQILEQIFRPAFSTRVAVSDVSGRGVGLDVVKSAIEEIGGAIRIRTRPGQGTDFILRLPVSIALVDALVLDLGRALYAVPSAYVERIVEVEHGAVETVSGREVVRLEDGMRVPILDLLSLLGFPAVDSAPDGPSRLAVIAEDQRRVALRVPGFVGELGLVQESLDPFLKGLRLVTGTAMLDGGRRVVMLNGMQLLDLIQETPRKREEGEGPRGAGAPASRTVLVIEDSDLTRSMVSSTLRDAGWRVVEAANGRDGLAAFAEAKPDALVTDLEMPLVDGFEVLRRVRADPAGARLPIVVLTTVAEDAARRRAAEAGADAYLLKSSFTGDALLETLDRLAAGGES